MEEYTPPQMPEYPTDLDSFYQVIKPYYDEERPLDLFFELLIIDVLGYLPEQTKLAIEEFSNKHTRFFESTNGDWKEYVKKTLELSSTIEIAILDLWYRNSQNAKDSGWEYQPWHYAMNFIDNYFAENSKVDIWEGNALEEAKRLIREHENR
jgi:hypothetical protein